MEKILEVKNLKISFRTQNGTVKAVRDISFDLEKGKTLAIVGESGSGKSVTSKAILGILAGNSIIEGGEILYDGKDLLKIEEDEMHKIRGDKISMIFQDPLSSLNPIVRIGKQITEAMLLKNKANRKEARREFNRTLALLKSSMISAIGEGQTAKISEMISTFDKFNIKADVLENSYNNANTDALDIVSSIEDTLFRISKNQKVDLAVLLAGYAAGIGKIKDEYLTKGYSDKLAALSAKLKNARKQLKAENGVENATATMEEAKALLSEMIGKIKPNFFRIGYYSLNNKSDDLDSKSIEEINEITLEYLDSHFMIEFLKNAQAGVEYSYAKALGKKKALIEKLEQAKKYFSSDFEKAAAHKYANSLSDAVEDSIDRLEIIKDSAAYTFRSSIENAIDRYFFGKESNPKEEKRFNRQNAKRDALIAKGKKVDWKVVPKTVYDLDDLKDDIVSVIERLELKYKAYISASDSVDFAARTLGVVDHLKEKASQVVYRITKSMAKEKAIKLMEEVGIHEPRRRFYQYPFEFSGGMRQRIVIAIALVANPDILICDEPTTALDVTIQAQILELINKLKRERNLSVIFITHDLGVVANMADDIAVMYAGKIVEYGTADDIFYDPRHPYTWALLSSMPDLDTSEKLDAIPGTPPNMIYPPVGDAFAERNKYAMQIDFEMQPPMFDISETHKAATWLLHPDAPKVKVPKIITDRIARMTKKNNGGAANE